MHLFRRKRAPIRRFNIYLIALLCATIVTVQSVSINENGQFVLNPTYILLFYIKYLVWALIFDWVFGLFHSFKELEKPILKDLLLIGLNTILLALVHGLISNVLFYAYRLTLGSKRIDEVVPEFIDYAPRIFSSRLVDLAIILGILKIFDLFRTAQKRKLKVTELENQLHMSQLNTLRAQLNPHFLFNSLHALHTLIGHDDVKAKIMVIKMSNLLRRILDQSTKQLVTLGEELDYLKDYLDIEHERFHDRLKLEFDIDPNSIKIMVPALIFQTLAENAFKHGISLLENEGHLKLSTKLVEKDLFIEMTNSIPNGIDGIQPNSTKVGLKNLRNRLKWLYEDRQKIEVERKQGIFKIVITLKNVQE